MKLSSIPIINSYWKSQHWLDNHVSIVQELDIDFKDRMYICNHYKNKNAEIVINNVSSNVNIRRGVR